MEEHGEPRDSHIAVRRIFCCLCVLISVIGVITLTLFALSFFMCTHTMAITAGGFFALLVVCAFVQARVKVELNKTYWNGNWNYVRHHGILAEGPEVTPVEQSVPDKMAMYHDTIYSTMQGFPNEGFRSSEHQTPSNDDDTKVVVPPAYDEIDFVILPSYDEALKDASIA